MNLPDTHLRDIPLTTIDGEATSLAAFGDDAILVVNVASRCGLAPQYEKLEQLQRDYGERGLTVIGFPSNQFLQELSDAEAIKTFCSSTYGVTFPLMEKTRVNGRSRHPLYSVLTETADADGKAGRITWNFEKFLIRADGHVQRFRPRTEPDAPEVLAAIESALPERA